MTRRHLTVTSAVLAGLWLAGCINTQNDRDCIGRAMSLEALTPIDALPSAAGTSGLQQPSVTGTERSNWAKSTFLIPVDGVAHNPSYSRRVYLADKTARQRRECPTGLSALQVTGGSESSQQLEAPVNCLCSLADVVLLIPGMIWQAPWSTRFSPDEAYSRYWHPEQPPPAPSRDAGTPSAVRPSSGAATP